MNPGRKLPTLQLHVFFLCAFFVSLGVFTQCTEVFQVKQLRLIAFLVHDVIVLSWTITPQNLLVRQEKHYYRHVKLPSLDPRSSARTGFEVGQEERKTDQVGEVVSILSGHQPAGVAESGDVLDVGLKSWRISLQHDVNERGEKVVGGRRLVLGDPNSAEDVFTAVCDAGQFVPRNPLRIHLNDIWNRPRFAHEGWNKELIRSHVY